MNCPRCSGRVLKGRDGVQSCYACGWEYVTPAEMSATRRQIEMDAAQRRDRGRIRPARIQGMSL